jgi:hypothetical protein
MYMQGQPFKNKNSFFGKKNELFSPQNFVGAAFCRPDGVVP